MLVSVPNHTLTVLIFKNRIWVGLGPGFYNFQLDSSSYPGFPRFFQYGNSLEYLVQIEFYLSKGKCKIEKICLMVETHVSHSLYILFSIISY